MRNVLYAREFCFVVIFCFVFPKNPLAMLTSYAQALAALYFGVVSWETADVVESCWNQLILHHLDCFELNVDIRTSLGGGRGLEVTQTTDHSVNYPHHGNYTVSLHYDK